MSDIFGGKFSQPKASNPPEPMEKIGLIGSRLFVKKWYYKKIENVPRWSPNGVRKIDLI